MQGFPPRITIFTQNIDESYHRSDTSSILIADEGRTALFESVVSLNSSDRDLSSESISVTVTLKRPELTYKVPSQLVAGPERNPRNLVLKMVKWALQKVLSAPDNPNDYRTGISKKNPKILEPKRGSLEGSSLKKEGINVGFFEGKRLRTTPNLHKFGPTIPKVKKGKPTNGARTETVTIYQKSCCHH